MSVDVQTEIEIDRPRSEVSAYAADPDMATIWYENIKAVRVEDTKAARSRIPNRVRRPVSSDAASRTPTSLRS